MRKVGVFGGIFDPVHSGHLSAARLVMEAVGLGEVWFMPSVVSKASNSASVEHRIAMLQLEIAHEPKWAICDLEMITGGRVPTSSLIRILCSSLKHGETPYWICGADSLLQMEKCWLGGYQALDFCQFVVVQRAGFNYASLPDEVKRKVILLERESPESYISSSAIRERVRRGLSLAGFVSEVVADYIKHHNLYGMKGDAR